MKTATKSLIILALGMAILLPGLANAQGIAERQEAFCALIDSRQASIADAFAKRVDAYEQAINLESTKHTDSRVLSEEAIKHSRTRADHKRAASYELIKSKQSSEENRLLTESYAAKVTEAVNARRISFDAARSNFLQEVDQMLSSRGQAVQDATDKFKAAADEALDIAKDECNTKTPAERPRIRQVAISRLMDARLDFKDKMHGRQDFKSGVQAAVRTRNQAYDNAVSEFQRAMQAIRTEYSGLQG